MPVDTVDTGFNQWKSGHDMRNDLIAKEVDVHPVVARATLCAAEKIDVETAGGFEIADGKSQVKGSLRFHKDDSCRSCNRHSTRFEKTDLVCQDLLRF